MSGADEIRWARRVRPDRIRRLYTLDAKGIVDEELIDEVGYAMYARCESIRRVTEAATGRVTCPRCQNVVRHRAKKDELLVCACGWEATWGEYLRSYQGKQLHGGGAYLAFLSFLERWPKARTPRDKMPLIDRLIHALHTNDRTGWVRPAAVNVIEGRAAEVTMLLEELAYGDLSTAGVRAAHAGWKRTIEEAKGRGELAGWPPRSRERGFEQ